MQMQQELRSEASQVISDILRPISVTQMRDYLEQTGWRLVANHFSREEGWSVQPLWILRPYVWVYSKSDLKSYDRYHIRAFEELPFVVEVPGREDESYYLRKLQEAVEQIAAIERTTFVTIVCRILGVQQLVLRPIETDLKPPDDAAEETS